MEEIGDDRGLRVGTVDFGGVRRRVCLEYTPGARVGAYVIVHVGFAITEVDEDEARRTLEVLRAMDDAVEREIGEPCRHGPTGPAPGPYSPCPGVRRAGR
ncbi:HypC/HybG/HupF family hydrogenase formation chaperone [Streptomyces sp. M19]